MREISSSADKKSIEESWLRLILDLRTPDKPFKHERYWISYGSGTGDDDYGRVLLTSSTLISGFTKSLGIARADEEKDRYWFLSEATDGHGIPQSSIYSAWVEGVYENQE